MSEQQYRVIADRDKGDDPDIDRDYREGDRLVFENWDTGYDDGRQVGTLVRIERPVPTTDEPKRRAFIVTPNNDRYDALDIEDALINVHSFIPEGVRVQPQTHSSLPTREQIAEAIHEAWGVRKAYRQDTTLTESAADAVLTLLQKGADR